jgi:hypothetical protein
MRDRKARARARFASDSPKMREIRRTEWWSEWNSNWRATYSAVCKPSRIVDLTSIAANQSENGSIDDQGNRIAHLSASDAP